MTHFTPEDVVLNDSEIALATVSYDTVTRRITINPAVHFGMADSFDPAEMFGQVDRLVLGGQLQSLAQMLPENRAVVDAANATYHGARAAGADMKSASAASDQEALLQLDQESPERTET